MIQSPPKGPTLNTSALGAKPSTHELLGDISKPHHTTFYSAILETVSIPEFGEARMEAERSLKKALQTVLQERNGGGLDWGGRYGSGERKFPYVLKVETAGFTDGSDVDCERRRVQDDSKVCLAWVPGKMEGLFTKMGKTAEGAVSP
jgi:hypothetical protein